MKIKCCLANPSIPNHGHAQPSALEYVKPLIGYVLNLPKKLHIFFNLLLEMVI